MNVPNLLTGSRVVLAIAFAFFAIRGQWFPSFWLFMAAAGTDMIDGTIARPPVAMTARANSNRVPPTSTVLGETNLASPR